MVSTVGRIGAGLALVVLLLACGDDDESSGTDGATTPTLTSTATATSEAGSPESVPSPTAADVPASATTAPELTPSASPASTATVSTGASNSLEYSQLAAWDADWQTLGALAIGPEGELYVADSERDHLVVYAADGSLSGTLEYPAPESGPDLALDDVAVGTDGDIYILENTQTTRVLQLRADGSVVNEWGGMVGFEEDSIFEAKAIAVAPDGHIFLVGGGAGARLQKFGSDGTFVAAWDLAGDYLFPGGSDYDLAVAGETLYVMANGEWNDRLAILPFDFDGNLAGKPVILAEPDEKPIVRPGSLAVGPDGNLFVADPVSREVVVISPVGEVLTRWTLEGEGPEIAYQLEVAVGADGRVYVADDLDKAIIVYGRLPSN